MSDTALGYGSKWHLLRYLGYRRQALNDAVLARTGGNSITWLDFPFNCAAPLLDRAWRSLEFLGAEIALEQTWRAFWPARGNIHNWDAVGQLKGGDWLLVEAKAHVAELISHRGASERGGLPMIRNALDITKRDIGASLVSDWLSPYYQYANRLAVLNFLLKHGVTAKLVFIYFLSDTNPHGECPATEDAWLREIGKVHLHLGLEGDSDVEGRTHTIFLPTCAQA